MKIKLLFIFLICILPSTVFAEYEGKTFAIDCSEGGFNNDQNRDRIPATAMVAGTRNINLHRGGRSKRGGTDNVNETPITDTPRVYGIFQYRLKNGNEFIITATGDGKIQSNYSTEIKTGLTIDQSVNFVTFNNLLIICTGNDLPQVWDGTGTTSALSNVPVDWSGSSNFPRKMVKHGRQASERLWAIGGAVDPSSVYASALSAKDGTTEPDFSDSNVLLIYIDTGDKDGIVNAVEFGDRLMCASKDRIYIIDDVDIDTANWGYEKSIWEGGCANDRLLVAVSNDIVSMTEDGTVYSVAATQSFGDYKKRTLTRPVFVDQWIRDNLNLALIENFHMVYDPVLRAINIFVVRKNKTVIDTALVYFIDRDPENGWVIKDNLASTSGYTASCSALIHKAIGNNKVYTGGWADGLVWELETSIKNDNGSSYAAGFRTPRFHMGDPRGTKRFDTGWVVATPQALDNDLTVNIWVDGVAQPQQILSLAGNTAVFDTAVFGTDTFGGTDLIELSFDIGAYGKRLEFQMFNNDLNEDFFVTLIMVDFEPMGSIIR